MSIDFNVYFTDPQSISAMGVEDYCKSIGFSVEVFPNIKFMEHSGFLPFKLSGDFFDETVNDRYYLTGFEMYINQFTYQSSVPKSKGLIQKMLHKTTHTEESFERAVKDKTTQIVICCSAQDSLESLTAHLFGAYLCKCNSGVFYNPQTDHFFTYHIALEKEITQIAETLRNDYKAGNLLIHGFDGWV